MPYLNSQNPGHLLQNLRIWVSTLRVSEIVVLTQRKEADLLAGQFEAARDR